MSTRSSTRNLFPPLDNPELTIRRRSRADPTLLNDFEMATEVNGDLPVPDLRTMEELCQPSLNGRGGPIALIVIQATKIKVNGVTDDALRLYLFPHSLTHHATAWFDRLPRNSFKTFEQMAKMFLGKYFPPSMVTKLRNKITNFRQRPDESLSEAWERYKLSIDRYPNHIMLPITQIDTFYNGLTLRHRDTINVAAGGTFMKRRPEECYELIENMTAHHNDFSPNGVSHLVLSLFFDTEITALKAEMANINKNLMRVLQVNQQVKAVTSNCETCGGPHSYTDCPTTVGQTQNVYAARAYQGGNSYQPQGIKETTILRGTTKEETNSSKELAMFMKMNTTSSSGSRTLPGMKLLVARSLCHFVITFMKMNTTSSSGSRTLPGNTITNQKVELKGTTTRSGTAYQGPTIPTTFSSIPLVIEREIEVTKDTVHPTNNGSTKDVQPLVVQTETPIQNSEPIVAPIIKPVAAPIDLNFNISFTDALILMPKFSPTIKTLLTNKDKLFELARTSLNEHCSAVLFKKLPEKLRDPGKFLIPCDFLGMAEYLSLTDLGASINLVPLSVWNKLSLPELSPMCMTLKLVDRSISRPAGVAEDIFVKVGTFHFPADFVVVDFDANPRVPLILKRSFLKTRRALIDVLKGDLTLRDGKEAITFNLDQTLRYSANYNDMTANRIDVIDMDFEEYLQEVLGNYLPQVRKELKVCEAKTNKSSIDEPPEVELKDLPPHLEYAFLEGEDKLPVIIVTDLSNKEKIALITVLKSHTRAITWKLSDINGIDPEFCTLKIMMKDDFELAVQHHRRVNPKIHNVIKKEVLKLLDAGLIYPIFNSPWTIEVFMGDFLVFENSFQTCLSHLEKMLKQCEDTNLYLNWKKSHYMVKEGIILGHKISKNGIEVDKAKVDIIAKLPHLTTVKGAVLGQRQEKHFRPIHYASKTMIEAESNYTTMEKEMLAMVYAFEKFRSYLIMNKSIMYTDHFALKYLFAKKDSKARLFRWVLVL
nr:hypothetical protein [Tanacetum cinerariifolium]